MLKKYKFLHELVKTEKKRKNGKIEIANNKNQSLKRKVPMLN